nr:hypothetical protein [Vibrio coralliirubri]
MVGPRPERKVFIEGLEKEIPYGASVEDAVWKHKFDIYCIKHKNW